MLSDSVLSVRSPHCLFCLLVSLQGSVLRVSITRVLVGSTYALRPGLVLAPTLCSPSPRPSRRRGYDVEAEEGFLAVHEFPQFATAAASLSSGEALKRAGVLSSPSSVSKRMVLQGTSRKFFDVSQLSLPDQQRGEFHGILAYSDAKALVKDPCTFSDKDRALQVRNRPLLAGIVSWTAFVHVVSRANATDEQTPSAPNSMLGCAAAARDAVIKGS